MFTRWLALALPLLVCAGAAPAEEKPKNLIGNPSLEDAPAANGLPAGWAPFCNPADTVQCSIVAGGRSGDKSLLVQTTGQYGGILTNKIPIEAGKRYSARGWAKVEAGAAGAHAMVKIDYLGPDQEYLGSTQYPPGVTTAQPGWQLVTVSDRAADFPKARTLVATLSLTGAGKARFDDVEMVARDGAPETSPVQNGGFEDVVASQAGGWYIARSSDANVLFTSVTEDPKEGERCLKLTGAAQWAVAACLRIKAEQGKTYTATGWVRVKSGTATIKFDYFKGEEYLGSVNGSPVFPGEWQQRSVTFDPAKFPQATQFNVAANGAGEFIEAYFDGLAVTVK